jgi:hypothetical protein
MIFAPFAYKQQVTATPPVITTGLVFYVDAGNTSSYPGTGTTWSDLSGNARNFTLTNGPIYNSGSGGYFAFDGVNDFAQGPSLNVGTGFTIECWVQTTTTATDCFIGQSPSRGIYFGSRPSGGVKLGISGQFDVPWGFVLSTSNINTGNWVYCSSTYDGANVKVYVNSSLERTTAKTGYYNAATIRIGDSGAGEYLIGNISIARLYNTVLTGTEIVQNYNAQKSRYGY